MPTINIPFKPTSKNQADYLNKQNNTNNESFVNVNANNKKFESAEEKRARAREAYSKLQDLRKKYKVEPNRNFTINDDPDEMNEEYDRIKENRHKENQVKFYGRILITIISGAEFVNDKYNPFEFKLKDWSKQVASDMDEYTEILEELYEKYKDKGGKMAPEIKLLFMIIMSGVTYHLSQTLFSADGLSQTLNKKSKCFEPINERINGTRTIIHDGW